MATAREPIDFYFDFLSLYGYFASLRIEDLAARHGRAVRWPLLFWRCLQRQKSFAAIVFSQTAPEDSALLSARCHG